MAWEAQLSAITADEVAARSARYQAEGIRVCWVATQRRSWVAGAAAVLARPPAAQDEGGQWMLTAGLWRFIEPEGVWKPVNTVALPAFVDWALHDRVVPRPAESGGVASLWSDGWTAPRYLEASRARRQQMRPQTAEVEVAPWRPSPSALPLPRPAGAQSAGRLTMPQAVAWRARMDWGWLPGAASRWLVDHGVSGPPDFDMADLSPQWAAGVPVRVEGRVVALLLPLPQALDWSQLPELIPVLVGTMATRDRLALRAPAPTRIIVLDRSGRAVTDL